MLEKFGIEGIYVVHALKGYELHEQRIKKLFTDHNLSFEFVTEGDPSYFTKLDLDYYFTRQFQDRIRQGTLSCTLNHIFCLHKVVQNKNKYALIFENDPFFIGDFLKKMQKIAIEAETLKPGFIISLENTTLKFPSIWQTKKGKLLYRAKRNRCAGAYMIDYKAAKDSICSLKNNKCNDVIDWWQNRLVERNIVQMYWAHPPVIEQGSHNGLFSSTISTKEKSTKRRISWALQKFYKVRIRRLFNRDYILEEKREL